MNRVLLAEDDAAIAQPLARALTREGYEVTVCRNGRDALAAGRENPALVILDLGLPLMDGLDVCRRLRAEGRTSPILILTARAEEVDTVVGLDAGADDYVTKPFRLAELLARVRALLRRSGTDGAPAAPAPPAEHARVERLEAGGVLIDLRAHRVHVGDQEVALTAKEFELLSVLVREADSVLSREDLMREVWETEWMGSTKTLDMHISLLRRKLAAVEPDRTFITTVRGIGFRFESQ